MRWTYFIEDRQVYPYNSRELKIKETLESDLLYAYRKELDGTVTLIKSDYDYIKTLEQTRRHEKFTFNTFDNGVLVQTSEFTIYDIEFDDYLKTCSFKVTLRDKYTEIQENEDIEVNVISGTGVDITYSVYSFLMFKSIAGINLPATLDTYWMRIGIIAGVFGYSENLYCTEAVIIYKDETAPVGFALLTDLEDYKIYQRYPVNVTIPSVHMGLNFDSEDFYDIITTTTYLNESWELKSSISRTYYYDRINLIFSRTVKGYELKASLNKVLSQACPNFTGTVKSSLFFGDDQESGKSIVYTGMTPNTIYLISISDFKKPNATQKTTKEVTTLKKIIEYLLLKEDLRWFIDENGDLRIEHVKYCEPTLSQDVDSDSLKYAYNSGEKPNREYMSESQAWNKDFGQIEVLYGTVPALNGVKENTKTKSLSEFYTDIDGLSQHLDQLSDGFLLVDTVNGVVNSVLGFKSGELIQNAFLSNANVLNTFHRYNAYQPDFYIAGKAVTALSLRRLKKQDINFTSVPDINKLLTTKIGNGKVLSLETKCVEENNFKAEVIYE